MIDQEKIKDVLDAMVLFVTAEEQKTDAGFPALQYIEGDQFNPIPAFPILRYKIPNVDISGDTEKTVEKTPVGDPETATETDVKTSDNIQGVLSLAIVDDENGGDPVRAWRLMSFVRKFTRETKEDGGKDTIAAAGFVFRVLGQGITNQSNLIDENFYTAQIGMDFRVDGCSESVERKPLTADMEFEDQTVL